MVQMRLQLDSTSAQRSFNRLGCGCAKQAPSTRLFWNQQAMRRKWFLVARGGAPENFADFKHEASFSRTTRIFDEED